MEINIIEYLHSTLFLCKRDYLNKNDESMDHLIKYCLTSEPSKCQIGDIVGVKCDLRKEWVRGIIEDNVSESHIKVSLIDHGSKYEVIRKTQVADLPEQLKYLPEFNVIGLDGVVPTVKMCRGCTNHLQMTLAKGPAYFTEKRQMHDIMFGDIVVIPRDKTEPINLTSVLLSKNFVRISNNFDYDIKTVLTDCLKRYTNKTSSEECEAKISEEKDYCQINTSTPVNSRQSSENTKHESYHPKSKKYSVKSSNTHFSGHQCSRSRQCAHEENSSGSIPGTSRGVPAGFYPHNEGKPKDKKENTCIHFDYAKFWHQRISKNADMPEKKSENEWPPTKGPTNCAGDLVNKYPVPSRPKPVTWGEHYKTLDIPDNEGNIRGFNFSNKSKAPETVDYVENKSDISRLPTTTITNDEVEHSTSINKSLNVSTSNNQSLNSSATSNNQSLYRTANSTNQSINSTANSTDQSLYTTATSTNHSLNSSASSINQSLYVTASSINQSQNNTSSDISYDLVTRMIEKLNNKKKSPESLAKQNVNNNIKDCPIGKIGEMLTKKNKRAETNTKQILTDNTLLENQQNTNNLEDIKSSCGSSSTYELSSDRSITSSSNKENEHGKESLEGSLVDDYCNYDKPEKFIDLVTPSKEELEELDKYNVSPFLIGSEKTAVLESLNAQGILVHSKRNPIVRPSYSCNDVNLNPSIKTSLDSFVRELNRIQRISFPAIVARQNLAMIAPKKSGKTTGYVVPLASSLLHPDRYLNFRTGHGPLALIICTDWSSASFVAEMFNTLSNCITTVLTYGGGAESEKKRELYNGCEVLVSTPCCILRLLDDKIHGFTNLKRLHHIVFDDADILFDKFKPQMEELLAQIEALQVKREVKGPVVHLQVIVAASQWTPTVQELVIQNMVNATLCIAHGLEACVYAGVKPVAAFMNSDRKIDKLIDILKNINGQKRVVIMCNSKEDVRFVYGKLRDYEKFNVLAADDDMPGYTISSDLPGIWHKNDVAEVWKDCQMNLPILIRSDEVLEDVPVSDAKVLILYNMPNTLKTFSLRFSCLMNNYPNMFLNQKLAKNDCEVYILVDEANTLELPGVMQFMKRLNTALPTFVKQVIENIEKSKEGRKFSEPICEDLKLFGECWDVKRCPARHILSPTVDRFDDQVPKTGHVKILVTHVHNTCHFSARLLEHSTDLSHWKKLNEDRTYRINMTKYFDVMRNRKISASPSVGDMVAIESSPGIFDRATVMEITRFDKKNEPSRVNIRLIDIGSYLECGVSRLYTLPDEVKVTPPAVVDVYMCGLLPMDHDTSWSPATTHWVKRQLRELKRSSTEVFIQGKIQLIVGRNLWLDPVECFEYLSSMDITVFKSSLRKELLKNENAIGNPSHIPKLRNICEKAGIQLYHDVPDVCVKKVMQVKPDWAWLPLEEDSVVNVTFGVNPEVIFVSLTKFSDCLKNLESELQEYANTQSSVSSSALDFGDICLHKSQYDEWNRAMIRGKPTDNEVELFYVDYGDSVTVPLVDIVPISNALISKLPFQAIECHLAGVQFSKVNNEWDNATLKDIINLTRDENTCWKDLIIRVCDKDPEAMMTGGNRYSVILLDFTCNNLIINSELIKNGIGQCLEDQVYVNNCKELMNNLKIYDDGKVNGNVDKAIGNVDNANENNVNTYEDSLKLVEVIPPKHFAEGNIVCPSESSLDEEIGQLEGNDKVLKFLKGLEENKFDISTIDFDDLNGNWRIDDNDALENEYDRSILQQALTSKDKTPLEFGQKVKYDTSETKMPKYQNAPFMGSSSGISSISTTDSNPEICLNQSNERCVDDSVLFATDPLVHNIDLRSISKKMVDEQYLISKSTSIIEENIIPQAQSSPKINSSMSHEKSSESVDKSCLFASPIHQPGSTNSFVSNSLNTRGSDKTQSLVEKLKPFAKHVSMDNLNQSVYDLIFPTEVNSSKANKSDTNNLDLSNTNSTDSFGEPDHLHTSTGTVTGLVDSNILSKTPVEKSTPRKCVNIDTYWKPTSQNTLGECSVNRKVISVDATNNLNQRKPLVKWHQNDDFICLLVNLPDLKDFTVHCDVSSIDFRAVYNDIEYGFNIELWGAHRKKNAVFEPRGLYFEIKLEKVLKGMKKYKWPRLTKSEEKLPWLKLNIEKQCEKEEDSEDEDYKNYILSLPHGDEDCSESGSEDSMDDGSEFGFGFS